MGVKLFLRILVTVISISHQQNQMAKMRAEQERRMREQQARMEAEADKRKGFSFTVSGQAAPLPIVYGKNVLGGIETAHKVSNNYNSGSESSASKVLSQGLGTSGSGSKNEFLHVQYALCHEGIEGVQWIKVNGVDYNDSQSKFQHRFRIYNDGGTADPAAVANGFPSTNTFTGTANASATYKLNRDDYNYAGVPSVEFLVKGRKIKTIVRSGAGTEADPYTYALSTAPSYSNNPAYCLLDYLMNANFGRGLPESEIDLESFYDAARVCDTIVMTQALIGGQVNGHKTIHTVADYASLPGNLEDRTYENEVWQTEDTENFYQWQRTSWAETSYDERRDIPLYECNMVINPEAPIRDNIEQLLYTMGLAELSWTTSGKYKLSLKYPTTQQEAEALVNPAHVFNEDNILKDEVKIAYTSASDRFNQATISFVNEHEDFKEDSISWPPLYSSTYNTYLAEDGNQPLKSSITSGGVTDPYHAQALCEQLVRRSRTLKSISFRVDNSGLTVEPGDFIKVTIPQNNLTDQIVRVEEIQVNSDLSVKISGYTFDHNVLAWNIANDIAYTEQPAYDFTVDAPTNLVYDEGSVNNDNKHVIGNLTWTDNNNGSAFSYDISYRVNGASDYIFLANTKYNQIELFNFEGLANNDYFDFKVQAKSPLGQLSDPVEITNQFVQKAPNEIVSLQISEEQYITNNASGLKNRLLLSWVPDNTGVLAYYYLVEYKRHSDSTYQTVGTTNNPEISIPDVKADDFDFRITPYSVYNYVGDAFEVRQTIIGFSAAPASPTGFTGNINEGQINLTWDAPTELDVLYGGHSEIKFHLATDGTATWDTASTVVSSLSGNTTNKTVPTLTGTFFIRFYDAGNRFSATPAQFISTFVDESFNFIQEYDQDAINYSGAKTNCTYNSSTSTLDLDANQELMVYEFNSVVDLNEIVTVRVTPDLKMLVTVAGVNVADYVNIATEPRFFGPYADATAKIYIATTDDDPNGTPTWSDWKFLLVSSYKARAMKFKLEIRTKDTNTAVSVTDLNVTIDKKDVIKTGTSTSSTSADTTVTYPTAFYAGLSGTNAPRVGIQTVGGVAGDQVVISSRDHTGFVYSIYNSGSRVQRTIDYQAIGQ